MKKLLVCLLFAFLALSRPVWALDKDIIAIQTILLEARGESYLGQVAVGEVIRNRALKAHQSVIEICLAPFQFSCWNNSLKAKQALNRVSGEEYQRASKAWYESETTHYTKGATYYIAKRSLKYMPRWIKALEEMLVIDHHTFYKES